MGWWSTTIMGGDSPLDVEDGIYEICKAQKWGEGKGKGKIKIPVKNFMDKLPQIISYIEEERGWYLEIGYQVLGVMMMEIGAPIPEELKVRILQAAEADEWAKQDEVRRSHCHKFAKTLRDYNGKSTKIESEGLFAAFNKFRASGGSGLINKIP